MKRLIAILTLIAVVCCIAACGKQEAPKHHDIVKGAIVQLKEYWTQEYKNTDYTDGYFEIKNTRVITIKDNDIEIFQDIAYIIEFELYTDYMGSAPYYADYGVDDTVVVYKNGTMDVKRNLVWTYRSNTYQTDYSAFIETIDDYCGQYNCIEKLK